MRKLAKKGSGKSKAVLVTLLSIAAGLVSYFGYRFWAKHKQTKAQDSKVPDPLKEVPIQLHGKKSF